MYLTVDILIEINNTITSIYKIKWAVFTKNSNIKVKYEIHEENDFYSLCIDCGFKKIQITDKEELSDLFKV